MQKRNITLFPQDDRVWLVALPWRVSQINLGFKNFSSVADPTFACCSFKQCYSPTSLLPRGACFARCLEYYWVIASSHSTRAIRPPDAFSAPLTQVLNAALGNPKIDGLFRGELFLTPRLRPCPNEMLRCLVQVLLID